MTELRQRNIPASDASEKQGQKPDPPGSDEEDELPPGMELGSSSDIPQGTDTTPEVLDTALKDLTPRWRNWVIRGIFTWVMILGFTFIIYLGPLALVLVIMAIQIKCFHEIINIGYVVYKSHNLPWFRTLSWYFLFASNWFFFGESLAEYFGLLLARDGFLRGVLTYHRFISFTMYVCGFVAFVFSLIKKHYLKQFTLFGWTHVTLLIVVFNSHLIIQNIFEGLIWLLVPVSMIICNDIMAYMFGFFFGKTPLIKLSPKKTWEGFIGGAISTILFSIALSYVLVQFDYFVCPISYDETLESLSMQCERNPVFRITAYKLPETLADLLTLMLMPYTEVRIYPFIIHCVFISLFASIVGPFGGFFASGFKRAFKIKDFGDTIPGHGGIMDRFDCQFLMALFVHVYHYSFIQVPDPRRLVMNVVTLKPEEQIQVFLLLKERLLAKGLINSTILS